MTAYVCQIVLTNVSPKEHHVDILYQIPQGSLPLKRTKYLQSKDICLQPYSTEQYEIQFYFPQEGEFWHFPTNVSKQGKVRAFAEPHKLKVVRKFSFTKTETFTDLVLTGAPGDLVWEEKMLEYLRTKDLVNES
jgi:hypothetical protein